MTINCDAACGTISPECADVCDDTKTVQLPYGVTYVRMPPVYANAPGCAKAGCPHWGLRLELPHNTYGLTVDGPPGISFASVAPGAKKPDECSQDYAGICSSGDSAQDPTAVDDYLFVGTKTFSNGALFTITVYQSQGHNALCNGGCNGSGD